MGQKFTDAARNTLEFAILSTDTSLTLLAGGSLFPVANTGTATVGASLDYFKAVIQDAAGFEIVCVRTHTSGAKVLSDLLRGQDGTTARSFSAGAVVGIRPTASDAAAWLNQESVSALPTKAGPVLTDSLVVLDSGNNNALKKTTLSSLNTLLSPTTLSGVTATALHRSPNAIVAQFIYDTQNDSDGGAWTERMQDKSWYNETLVTGAWWAGGFASESAARTAGATTNDYFQLTTDGKFYSLNAGSGVTETFRGNKAKFPRLAAIVAEATNVTIYDLTEAGRPMWMRFVATFNGSDQAGGSMLLAHPTQPITGVAALNGVFGVSASNNTNLPLTLVNFGQDGSVGYDYSRKYIYKSNIANRNTGKAYASSAMPGLGGGVSNGNAVAITVLPDAPVDPTTGLQVPTIAVATSGGVSIIKHDGTVVSSTALDAHTVTLSPNMVTAARGYAGSDHFYILNPGSLQASFLFSSFFSDSFDAAGNTNKLVQYGGSRFAKTVASSVVLRRLNTADTAPANIGKSLTTLIRNTSNTGWLVGDVRRAYLADVSAGSVVGTELVTNGTFDTAVAPWTADGGASIASVGGELIVTNTAGGSTEQAALNITSSLVNGKSYELLFSARKGTAASFSCFVEGEGGLAVLATQSNVAMTKFRLIFTYPVGYTICVIRFRTEGVGSAIFDNVSLHEAILDRSYKAAAATVTGTLTKTAVGTGSQLVAYSGFSAANYAREPWNADLDFGTGEWRVSAFVKAPVALPASSFPAIGSEPIVNGDFAVGTSWTLVGGAAITGGQLVLAPTGTASAIAYQNFTVVAGKIYKLTYDKVSGAGNTTDLYIEVGQSFGSADWYASGAIGANAAGAYTVYFQVNAAAVTLSLYCVTDNPASVTLDNFSMKEADVSVVAERATSSGPSIKFGLDVKGKLVATAFDGTTTRTVTTTAAYNSGTWLKAAAQYTTDGKLAIRVNGVEVATATGTPLLSLNSRYNLLTYTEDFSNAAYGKEGLTIPVTNGTGPAVIPRSTANTLQETAVTGFHGFNPASSPTVAGQSYTISIYAKANTRNYCLLYTGTNGGTGKYFDLTAGAGAVLGNYSSNAPTSAAITDAGGGWYLCSMTYTANATSSTTEFYLSSTGAVASYAGDITKSIFATGMQHSVAGMPYQRVGAANDFDFQAPLTIGNNFAGTAPFPGSIALVKLGATLPTAEQGAFMYAQESQMFRDGAQVTLPDAGAVVDLSYDEVQDKWVAVSATNESSFTGLVRTSTAPVSAGSLTKVSTQSGVKLLARSTTTPGVDITIPSYGLREELVKRGEQAAKRSRAVSVFDFDAVTAQTDFTLPVGLTAKTVFAAGVQKREGTTKDYVRRFDGFVETIRFNTAPGNTVYVQIQAAPI